MFQYGCEVRTDERARELKEHGSLEFPAGCYYADVDMASVSWHWHEACEAFVLSEGTAEVAMGAQRVTLRAGDGVFINADTLHGVWGVGEGACKLHTVVFHPRLIGGSMESVFWRRYLLPVLNAPGFSGLALPREEAWGREAVTWVETAWEAGAAERPGYEFVMREELSKLIAFLFARLPQIGAAVPEKAEVENRRMKVMLQYVQEHFAARITTAEIAQSANISESECLRCFKDVVGMPPIQYLKQLRVQWAAGLLSSTERKIADIGEACGFQGMSYFAKTFRACKGCSPKEYRQRHRARGPARGNGETEKGW